MRTIIIINIILSVVSVVEFFLLMLKRKKNTRECDDILEDMNFVIITCCKKVISENPSINAKKLVELGIKAAFANINKKISVELNEYFEFDTIEYLIMDNTTLIMNGLIEDTD